VSRVVPLYDSLREIPWPDDMMYYKRPGKPRLITVTCSHGWEWVKESPKPRVYHFQPKIVIICAISGMCQITLQHSGRDAREAANALFCADGIHVTFQFRCPACRCHLERRDEKLIALIARQDAIERYGYGSPGARIAKLDISTAVRLVL
jgi:hypothetical protein